MIATQDAPTRSTLRLSSCSICGKSVRVNPLKATDTDVICRSCRCKRCSIPISARPCDRCGVAHGTPSEEPGLCERCFETAMVHSGVSRHTETVPSSHSLWVVSEEPATSLGGDSSR
jgi:hypothetical protein